MTTTIHRIALAATLFCAVTTASTRASAQLELPAPSPAAKVMQRVGLTDVTVEYSSPAVKNRKVWGTLVPFDKPWRTGANSATKITFSKDVTFGGKAVPAGTYSIVTHPTAKGWTVALSKELTVVNDKSDPAQVVAKVPATTSQIPMRERMAFMFSNTTDDATSLDLEWEKLRISVPIKVDTAAHAAESIKNNVDNAWRAQANTARYIAESSKNYDAALKYVDTSIAMNPNHWFNQWVKADILAKKGDVAGAIALGQTAYDLGMKEPPGAFFLKADVEKALADWKKKAPAKK